MNHLAVLHEPYLRAILDGSKTVESCLSKNRCTPFGVVNPGDIINFKFSGGPFAPRAIADAVGSRDGRSPRAVRRLHARLNALVAAPAAYRHAKRTARSASFFWLGDAHTIDRGPIIPALNGRNWLLLGNSITLSCPRTGRRQHQPSLFEAA